MTSPLLGSIAKTVAAATKGVLYPLTVSQVSGGGEYDPETGGVTPPVFTSYPCRGFIEDYSTDVLQRAGAYLDGTLIQPGDHKITIAAATLAIAPKPTDTVTAKGVTYTVITASQDAAGATWTLLVR